MSVSDMRLVVDVVDRRGNVIVGHGGAPDVLGKEKGPPVGEALHSKLFWDLDYNVLPNIKRPWRIATAVIITTIPVLSRVIVVGLII